MRCILSVVLDDSTSSLPLPARTRVLSQTNSVELAALPAITFDTGQRRDRTHRPRPRTRGPTRTAAPAHHVITTRVRPYSDGRPYTDSARCATVSVFRIVCAYKWRRFVEFPSTMHTAGVALVLVAATALTFAGGNAVSALRDPRPSRSLETCCRSQTGISTRSSVIGANALVSRPFLRSEKRGS